MSKKDNAIKLTERQKMFCRYYIIDLNATRAAKKAGYKKTTAYSQGQRLLKDVEILDYIKSLQAPAVEKLEITAERVLNELAKIGFANIKQYIEQDFKIKDFQKLSDDQTAVVSQIEVTEKELYNMKGDNYGNEKQVKFKLHDKISALSYLGKHLGIFEKYEKQEKEPEQQFYLIGDKKIIF